MAVSQHGAVDERRWDLASIAVMALVSSVMVLTVDDYGFTYDEQYHYTYGENVLNWFLTLGADRSALGHNHSYGVGYALTHAILVRLSPFSPIDTAHYLCVAVALLALLGTWNLARWLGGSLGGFLGLVFLVGSSVYYGQQFNNPKDIPFAAGYVWGLYYALRAASEPITAPKRFWAAAGLAFAAAMSVRLVGGVVLGYALLSLSLLLLEQWRKRQLPSVTELRTRVGKLGAAMAGGTALVVAVWPWLHSYPFVEKKRAGFEGLVKFKGYAWPTLLHGKLVPSQDVPWDYIPSYFVRQLGEVFLLFTVLGFVAVAVRWAAAVRGGPWPRDASVVSVAVLMPPAFAIISGSTVYNGLRHFLFIIPPLACLTAFGAVWTLRGFCRAAQRARPRATFFRWGYRFAVAVLVVGLLEQGYSSIELHPQQQVYFNRASGGVKAAIGEYVTEYYGSTYKELTRSFSEQLWRREPRRYLNRSYAVSGCGDAMFFQYNLPENFHFFSRRRVRLFDYYITYVRDNCHRHHRRVPVVHRLVKQEATLALVRDMNAPKKKRPRQRGR